MKTKKKTKKILTNTDKEAHRKKEILCLPSLVIISHYSEIFCTDLNYREFSSKLQMDDTAS